MKRFLSLVFVLLLSAVLCLPAMADVIVEPSGDLFYETHRDECDYVNRGFLVNGEKGSAPVYNAPNSFVQVQHLANGTRVSISHVWTDKDGAQWGTGWSIPGWMRLDDLALIYSTEEFVEDHAAELAPYDGSADTLSEVFMYSYPGGVYLHTMPIGDPDNLPTYTYIYTDADGLRWTYVGYYCGHRNAWLCIDDPMNGHLGVDAPLSVDQVRSSTPLIPAGGRVPPANVVWLVPAALIVVAAAVTAIIVRIRRKKRSAAQ